MPSSTTDTLVAVESGSPLAAMLERHAGVAPSYVVVHTYERARVSEVYVPGATYTGPFAATLRIAGELYGALTTLRPVEGSFPIDQPVRSLEVMAHYEALETLARWAIDRAATSPITIPAGTYCAECTEWHADDDLAEVGGSPVCSGCRSEPDEVAV